MMSQITLTTVIQLYNTEKIEENSRANNVIQYSNHILVL